MSERMKRIVESHKMLNLLLIFPTESKKKGVQNELRVLLSHCLSPVDDSRERERLHEQ